VQRKPAVPSPPHKIWETKEEEEEEEEKKNNNNKRWRNRKSKSRK
jgi:hypothetical protein